jgi:hypothetical protein
MKDKTLVGVMFGILVGMVLAQSGNLSAQAAPVATCEEAKTIWRDASRFSRKNNGAENMSKKHNEYTVNGWKFVDMETYIENSDLEGFFLTYSREVPCGKPVG